MKTIFVDEAESFYSAITNGGRATLISHECIPGTYDGFTGEVVTIGGYPVFRVANEGGQYITHLLSTEAVQKLRRRVEDTLRKGSYSLTLRTARAAHVSLT